MYGAGLGPFIGFYHGTVFGRESLACDVMEALRPHADRFVIQLFRKETLAASDFSKTDGACLMSKAPRGRFYVACETEADGFRRLLDQAVQDIVKAVEAAAHADVPARSSDWDPDGGI